MTEIPATRRQLFGLAGIVLSGSLAGCFGSDDESGDNEQEDGDDDDEEQQENGGEEMDPEDATETVASFVEAAHERDETTYEQLHHPDGVLVQDGGGQQISFPTGELESSELIEGDEESATVTGTVMLAETDSANNFEFDLRPDDGEWLLWDWDLATDVSTPTISPEVFVEEFFDALEDREEDKAAGMVAEDFEGGRAMISEITQSPGISLLSVDTVESGEESAEVDVTFSFVDGDGTEQEETERWELQAADGQWLLAGFL